MQFCLKNSLYAFLMCCYLTHPALSSGDVFDQNKLHEIRITTPATDWYDILWNYYQDTINGTNKKFIKTTVEIDGELIESVGFRMRGNYSNTGFEGKKKPFRLDFDKYVDNRLFQGIEKLNLNNFASDPSFTRELVSYNLMHHLGITASRCSFTQLYINNSYWGCYLILEEPDEHFIHKNFSLDQFALIENKGNTVLDYKGNSMDNYPEFSVQYSNMEQEWVNYDQFLSSIHSNQSLQYASELQKHFDLELFFRVLAVDVFISNYDSYATNKRNFFLLNNPESGKIQWIPYDYNMTFWNIHYPPFPCLRNSSYMVPLVWNMHENEHLNNDYLQQFCGLLASEFQTFPVDKTVKDVFELIKEAVLQDTLKFYTNDSFLKSQETDVSVTFKMSGKDVLISLPCVKRHYNTRLNQLKYLISKEGVNCESPENESLNISVYPNPCHQTITILSPGLIDTGNEMDIQFYNSSGARVTGTTILPSSSHIDIPTDALATGNYRVKVRQGNKAKIVSIIKN